MCNINELRFSVFVIHHLAKSWNKSPYIVYKTLNDTHIMDDYIIGCYDTLHTQGEQALLEDITDFVREKGVAI
jgi:hypothetical protein